MAGSARTQPRTMADAMLPAPSRPRVNEEEATRPKSVPEHRPVESGHGDHPAAAGREHPQLARAGGLHWLAALPAAVAGLAARWGLTVGEPFGDDGAVSWVAPATTAGGSEAVLKVFLPDLENRHEPDALRHYRGRGAVRLLEDEPGALLLERLRPGTSLWQLRDDDEAARIVAGLLEQLWHAPADGHPFRTLAGDAMRWSTGIPEAWAGLSEPFERELADLGGALAAELAQSQC